ncbi:MAG: lipopolysaccharide transport periplasmic protein LptA [Oxalobacter sp.]|nr:MAG: lipopolysaccharide transport periplasmic protein LptA [Oxalobacter sp.]
MNKLLGVFIVALCLISTGSAWGEQADSAQPTKITSNQMKYDDVNQVNTFIGNVRLTRGTLIMRGEKMIMRQDPAGNQHGTLYGRGEELATFRQKRDGGPNLWVEGYAERMEYDSNTEVSKLFYRAKLIRLDGKKIIDEVNGNFISYDSKTETYTVSNVVEGDPKTKGERIKIILPPREDKKHTKDTPVISGDAPVRTIPLKEK